MVVFFVASQEVHFCVLDPAALHVASFVTSAVDHLWLAVSSFPQSEHVLLCLELVEFFQSPYLWLQLACVQDLHPLTVVVLPVYDLSLHLLQILYSLWGCADSFFVV